MNSRTPDPDRNRPATTDELLAHADWVRMLSRALLSDPNEADDVAQDAWVAALKRPPTAGDGLRAWWARVVQSSASNRRRSEERRKRARALSRAAAKMIRRGSTRRPTFDAQRRLVAAIEALDEPLRRVIIGRYFHGLNSRQIAERERVPDSTVRTRLQKALECLRRELDERAGGDRQAWAMVLAPLARLDSSALPAAATAVVIATWVKLAAGIALVGLAGFAAHAVLRAQHAPEELANSQPVLAEDSARLLSAPMSDSERMEAHPPASAADPIKSAASEEPVARVVARVLDAHGVAIGGARMKLTDRSAIRECTDEEAPQALSDAAGIASVSIRDADRSRRRGKRAGLPPNTWDGEFELSCRGYATRKVAVTLVLGEPSALGDVVLQDGADLSGRCIASDGTPLAKSRVQLMYPDLSLEERAQAQRGSFSRSTQLRSAVCASDGSFSMPGVPVGCFRVYATAEKRSGAFAEPFLLSTGEQFVVPDLVLEDCAIAIRGTVLTADGKPCADAELEYTFGAEDEFVGTRAEKDGTFTLVGSSAMLVELYARDSGGDSGEAVLRGVRPGELGLVLKLPPARRFDVHVDDPSGAPVERYSLGVHTEDGTGFEGTVTAPGGTYSQIARARPFKVRVGADGFSAQEQGPFTQENVPTTIAFHLPDSSSVSGRVVGNGGPENWLVVHLDAPFGEPRLRNDGMPQLAEPGTRASVRDDGSFAIGVSGSGRFMLWGEGRTGNVVFTQPVELAVGHPLEGLVIDVAASGSIKGHVETTLETRGRAAQVLYSCGLDNPRCERIAPDGSYSIDGLAPGSWWLRVMPDTSNSSQLLPAGTQIEDSLLKRVEVTASQTSSCDFDVRGPESRCLEGRMLLDGHACPSWTATLAPEDRWWDAYQRATLLSAKSSFRLQAATFGTQILSLRSPGTVDRDDCIEARLTVPSDGLRWVLECELGALDVEGNPGAAIQVHAGLPNGALWTMHAILDASGHATLDALPAAKARVIVAGKTDSPIEVEIPAHGRTQVRLP